MNVIATDIRGMSLIIPISTMFYVIEVVGIAKLAIMIITKVVETMSGVDITVRRYESDNHHKNDNNYDNSNIDSNNSKYDH